jgi:hypothetical protein
VSSNRLTIYENSITKERLEISLPLTRKVDIDELRKQIGLPEYVDVSDFQMQKAIVILWASRNATRFVESVRGSILPLALFGGGAFRVQCPSLNSKGSLHRRLNDLDFITLSEYGSDVVRMLCNMASTCGTMFFHGLSSSDRRLNALRGGKRYRVRAVNDLGPDGVPIPGMLDIICDSLDFCHKINVREDVSRGPLTLSLENLLLSKTQLIMKVPKEHVSDSNSIRVIGDFRNQYVLLGMELKDTCDVLGLLCDHGVGEAENEFRLAKIRDTLKQDWGLAKTVVLNLRNMHERLHAISGRLGMVPNQEQTIRTRLSEILGTADEAFMKAKRPILSPWKQWWQDVEEPVLSGTKVE